MPEFYRGPNYSLSVDKERREIDVANDIARLQPDETPFSVILMRARKKSTGTVEYTWWDSELGSWWTQINSETGHAATVNSLVVDDESIFAPNDVIKVPRTGEVIYVTGIDEATHKITVLRGYGTTAAAALTDNDRLMRIGNAMEEFSKAPKSKLKQPMKGYNYTQIFRTPFDQSMTGEAENLRTTESERTRLRKDKAVDHRLDMERAFLFGERKEDINNKRRMTGGLFSFLTTNVKDCSGTPLTLAEWEKYCEMLFAYGAKKKLFVCGRKVASQINSFAAGKLETRSGEETFGIAIKEYISIHGTVLIVTSQTFENEYAGWGVGLEMKNIVYRPLQGRDTKLKTNIQDNDADGWKDEYFTESGLQVRLEKTHAVLKNAV